MTKPIRKNENLIIGFGIVGFLIASYFEEKKISYKILSCDLKFGEGLDKINNDLFNKIYLGSTFSSKRPEEIANKELGIYSAKSIGGLCNVWGASLSESITIKGIQKLLPKLNEKKIKSILYKSYKLIDIKSHFFSGSSYFSFLKKNHLALNISECTKCNTCFKGCHNDAIYNITLAKNFNKIKKNFICGEVIKIVEKKNKIIFYKKNNKNLKTLSKNIFIACGPFETAKILINSNLCSGVRIQNKDHFISFHILKAKVNHNISLATHVNKFYLNKKPFFNSYYFNPNILGDIILKTPLKFFINYFRKIFQPRILLVQSLLDSSISSEVVVKKKLGQITYLVNNLSKKKIYKAWFVFKNKLKKTKKVFFSFLYPFVTPGSGNHCGSLVFYDKKGAIIDKSLIEKKNIYITGSSALPSLPTGSIVGASLVFTYNALEKIFKR